MRKHLFRAWDKENKKWLWPYEGFSVIGEVTVFNLFNQNNIKDINNIVIVESTGLYDSTLWKDLTELERTRWTRSHMPSEWRGKMIFEGDLVKTATSIQKVLWLEEGAQFITQELDDSGWDIMGLVEYKIVGHIFEEA